MQNPFVSFDGTGAATVLPPSAARENVNRLNDRPGKNYRPGLAEEVVEVFAHNGFVQWGGYWDAPIDYQHFEIGTRSFTERVASVPPAQAQHLYDNHVRAYRACMAKANPAQTAARAACVAGQLQ